MSTLVLWLENQQSFNNKVHEIVLTLIHHNQNNKDTAEHTVV